jgi:glycerophosphoryl diester phosphodiesterase
MSLPRFLPPVIAHRGASALAPENTLSALRLAHASGARWVEFDVKLTRDGMPILMHDDTLNRTTDGKGGVADIKWADMQKLDAGGWFKPHFAGEPVPYLGEALRVVLESDMQLNLEIKPCPGRAQATAMVAIFETSKIWPEDRPPPLISSFDEEALSIAAQLQPHWPRSFAFEKWRSDWREAAAAAKAQALTVDADLLTREHMPELVSCGLAILPYTVDDAKRAKQLIADGASAVFCNDPKAMIAAL